MVREEIGPWLRQRGFKKRRNRFPRGDEFRVAVVDFQASQWGSHDHVRFTINVWVGVPELAEGDSGDDAHVQERIGALTDSGEDRCSRGSACSSRAQGSPTCRRRFSGSRRNQRAHAAAGFACSRVRRCVLPALLPRPRRRSGPTGAACRTDEGAATSRSAWLSARRAAARVPRGFADPCRCVGCTKREPQMRTPHEARLPAVTRVQYGETHQQSPRPAVTALLAALLAFGGWILAFFG
jgi:Domain of unknown function (DUF4304)